MNDPREPSAGPIQGPVAQETDTTPAERGGMPPWLIYLLGILGALYLLNPTAGLFELIPDNLPFVGNLDDGVAAVLIWTGIQEWLKNRKRGRL